MRKIIITEAQYKLIKESFLHHEHVNKLIEKANINGFGGLCGAFAIALNQTLFNNQGEYVVSTNQYLWDNGHIWLAHVAVLYDGGLYDSSGMINLENFESWGTTDEEENDPLTDEPMGENAYEYIVLVLTENGIENPEQFIKEHLPSTSNYVEKFKKILNTIK